MSLLRHGRSSLFKRTPRTGQQPPVMGPTSMVTPVTAIRRCHHSPSSRLMMRGRHLRLRNGPRSRGHAWTSTPTMSSSHSRTTRRRGLSTSSSSSSSSSSSPPQQQQQQRQQGRRPQRGSQQASGQGPQPHEDDVVPRWPALLSVLVVPAMFAGWGVAQWVIGNRRLGDSEELRRLFLAEHCGRGGTDGDGGSDGDGEERLHAMPVLFHCVIRRTHGFAHTMAGGRLRVGDVVEVLQEGVGPDRSYNLCRLPADPEHGVGVGTLLATDTYGWFPTRWLQKLDHYEAIVRRQHQHQQQED